MDTLTETKLLMKQFNIHAIKNLGQNFLFDEQALSTIAQDVTQEDTVLEIGPGLGNLTELLVKKAKKVIAVEKDPKMCEVLKKRFLLEKNLEIINDDILKVDIDKITPNSKVVANLPYYITTTIITELLKSNIKDITILIQKEVAQRICAEPGSKEAGAITYLVNYYADAEIVDYVTKECFIPSPKVDSAIVRITKLKEKRVKVNDEEKFFEIIKANFNMRRKTLTNSLSSICEKDELIKTLKQLNIDENVRGEKLTLQQFADIANLIS